MAEEPGEDETLGQTIRRAIRQHSLAIQSRPFPHAEATPSANNGELPGTKTLDYIALGLILAPPAIALEMYFRGESLDWSRIFLGTAAFWVCGALILVAAHGWQRWRTANGQIVNLLTWLDTRFWGRAAIVLLLVATPFGISLSLSPVELAPVSTNPTILTGDNSPPISEGRPLGFLWNAATLSMRNNQRVGGPPADASICGITVLGKNLGSDAITLKDAFVISAIDGQKLQAQIYAVPGGWVPISDAGPIPANADFSLNAPFGGGWPKCESETEFLNEMGGFYFVVEYGDQKIRHEFTRANLQKEIDTLHPERRPHVSKRAPN